MIGAFGEIGIWVSISSPCKPEAVMLVSAEDYALAAFQKWTLDNTGYAVAKVEGRKESIHRLIVGASESQFVDHINRDRLDNRRSNLRQAQGDINGHNRTKKRSATSRFCGVSWNRSKAKWIAQIRRGPIQQHLGHFNSELHAAVAYDVAAAELYGQAARLNFPCGALAWTR